MKRIRKKQIPLWLGLLILILVVGNLLFNQQPESPSATPESELQVHFIDVGQADCILLTNGEEHMLIDAGNNDDGDFVTAYLQSMGISTIDYLVGTHPHEDHIGGLDTVIANFQIKNLLMPKIQANTKTFEDV